MISLFAEKEHEEATLTLYRQLEDIDLPKQFSITINNTRDAESGVRKEDGKVVEVSLAHCYSIEDVVRELARLIGR